jgi:thiazole biosynthesis enzyme
MQLDDVAISRVITRSFMEEFLAAMDVDVAIGGAGPSGLAAAYYLAKRGVKTVIFERALRPGGGMPGGGMMFNTIVVQAEAKPILDEFGVRTREIEKGYFAADAVETSAALCLKAIQAGAKVFNLMSIEDVMIRENDRVTGLVINWTAVDLPTPKLHVDPMSIRSKLVIDATGHAAEIVHIITDKLKQKLNTETGCIMGERSMWADVAEGHILENNKEVYPGLLVAGMAANAVCGTHRMGPIFGGMLLSGKWVAEVALRLLGR